MVQKYVLYHYKPSFLAATAAMVLFANTTLFHLWQIYKHKTWYFIPFIIGGIFEIGGYTGRMISSRQSPDWQVWPYVMQSLLLLLAPALLAASIYMILGRIITLTDGDSRSMIKRRWITKIFVAGDIISFLGQSAGGGILANAKTDSQVTLGERAITGGLIAQLLFFGVFIIVAGNFHFRMARKPTSRSLSLGLEWQTYLLVLYFASILIMVRSVFRVVEYIQGSDGSLLRHEMYLYLFDAALMFITMLLFNFAHPSKAIAREKLQLSSTDVEATGSHRLEAVRPNHRQSLLF